MPTRIAADPLVGPKVQKLAGGDALVVEAGGQISIETGATLFVKGTDVTDAVAGVATSVAGAAASATAAATSETNAGASAAAAAATLAAAVAGAASGYKLARGSASITGATGGDIVTGLTTVVALAASLGEDSSLAGNHVSATLGGTAGHITLKVWKPTATGDCTPILATAAKTVNWVAVGT